MKGDLFMASDGIKFRGSDMTQTISEISAAIRDIEGFKEKNKEIKQRMMGTWSGSEAEAAFARLDDIDKNLQEMIDIQTRVRDALDDKNSGFTEASTML